jgi:hypothetical protein
MRLGGKEEEKEENIRKTMKLLFLCHFRTCGVHRTATQQKLTSYTLCR